MMNQDVYLSTLHEIIGELEAENAELLEACEKTTAWFSKFYLTHSITFEGAPELVMAIDAAIANAKGE